MKKTPEELWNTIRDACRELGWSIALDDSNAGISGAIIGRRVYVEEVLQDLPDKDKYVIHSIKQENSSLH